MLPWRRCAVVCGALLCFVLVSLPGGAAELGSDNKPLNGMAPIYARLPQSAGAGISADLTLPRVSENQGWYANWVMVVDHAPPGGHVAFVQVGLMRRQQRLYLFTAYQRRNDPSITYRDVPLDRGARMNRFEITVSGSRARGYYDGRPVFEMPDAFDRTTGIYGQVGPEVSREGDSLAGTVREIVVKAGASRTALGGSVCHYSNHGVVLADAHNRGVFVAKGVFDRTLPSRFFGDCTGI